MWMSTPLACASWSLLHWSTHMLSAAMQHRSTGRCPRLVRAHLILILSPLKCLLSSCIRFAVFFSVARRFDTHLTQNELLSLVQGILPAGLAKVPTRELAEFISVCIAPRLQRPRARHLLKHPYFHTIRAEKAAVKLGAEALAHSVSCAADLHQMVADCTASVAGSVSRTSSELAEVSIQISIF